jgi:hypothetical protein
MNTHRSLRALAASKRACDRAIADAGVSGCARSSISGAPPIGARW